jgi:hypothetical protein
MNGVPDILPPFIKNNFLNDRFDYSLDNQTIVFSAPKMFVGIPKMFVCIYLFVVFYMGNKKTLILHPVNYII